jgi:hypothetical protein
MQPCASSMELRSATANRVSYTPPGKNETQAYTHRNAKCYSEKMFRNTAIFNSGTLGVTRRKAVAQLTQFESVQFDIRPHTRPYTYAHNLENSDEFTH